MPYVLAKAYEKGMADVILQSLFQVLFMRQILEADFVILHKVFLLVDVVAVNVGRNHKGEDF